MKPSDMFKDFEQHLSEEDRKWNKMLDLWTEGEAASPYAELLTYQGEVYNGGYYQYFCNVDATGDLRKEMSALRKILPPPLWLTLWLAYRAYLFLEKHPDKEYSALEWYVETSEYVFYLYEKRIDRILKAYAATVEL